MFFKGECYIVELTYKKDNQKFRNIYFWLGTHRSQVEQTRIALLAMEKAEDGTGSASQVRVPMLQEPSEFHSILFTDRLLLILEGQHQNQQQFKESMKSTNMLFRIKSQGEGRSTVIQLPVDCNQLNSNDCFVLLSPQQNYLWLGVGCTAEEHQVS